MNGAVLAEGEPPVALTNLLSYPIAPELGIVLIPTVASAQVLRPILDFGSSGLLQSIELINFTGRIVFQRSGGHDSITSVVAASEPSSSLNAYVLQQASSSQFERDSPLLLAPAGLQPLPATLPYNEFMDSPKADGGSWGKLRTQTAQISALGESATAASSPRSETMEADQTAKASKLFAAATTAMTAQKIRMAMKNAKPNSSAVFRKIVKLSAPKHTIPDEIRSQRSDKRHTERRMLLQRQSEIRGNGAGGASAPAAPAAAKYRSTTPLHDLCNTEQGDALTLEALFDCLNDHPQAISTKDAQGRYPLHVLGDNDALVSSDKGRNVATVFAGHLINEFPAATTCPDKDGYVPFVRILADWIDWSNDQDKIKKMGQSVPPKSESLVRSVSYYKGHANSRVEKRRGVSAKSWQIGTTPGHVFPRVEVWEEAEWCISMLSTVLDILTRNQNTPMFQRLGMTAVRHAATNKNSRILIDNDADDQTDESVIDDRDLLVKALVEKVPSLVTTVLLVDDDGMDTRARLLEKVLLKRLLLCDKVVGKWLIFMLNHGGIPAKRAVDYLSMISHVSIDDYTGGLGDVHSSDKSAFFQKRKHVFEAVGALKGTIASLVTLDLKETERAASTAVIWHVMGSKLSRPFVLGLVLIDLVLHVTLMGSFRTIALLEEDTAQIIDVGGASGAIVCIAAHYLLRKACEAWILLTVSRTAFKSYFTNFWVVFDVLAVILTLLATILKRQHATVYYTGLNCLIMGLLWIKVLGFLKVVNKQISTFIMALAQILLDIRLFMVVLFVCIIMFGEMFHIAVSTKDNGQYCKNHESESGVVEDFCGTAWNSYLRTYSILLGDFELDDMTETHGTTVLFVIFTVFGVVILLSVLIAVVSDSYDKATMSGSLLFGRARVLYVAQHEALEEFLKPKSSSEQGEPDSSKRLARRSMRWIFFAAILVTAIYTAIFLLGIAISMGNAKEYLLLIVASTMFVTLLGALWVVNTFILDELLRYLLPDGAENVYDCIGRMNGWFVKGLSNVLFGLTNEKAHSLTPDESTEEDWTCRIKYLETVMQRMMVETKNELRAEILEMRADMHDHFEEKDSNDQDYDGDTQLTRDDKLSRADMSRDVKSNSLPMRQNFATNTFCAI